MTNNTEQHSQHQRGAICIDCRTPLAAGEACDGGPRHRTTDLESADGREALLREVWGPPGLRRRARQMAAAGGGGAGVGMALEGGCEAGGCALDCVGASAEPAFLVILVLAGVGVLLYLLVAWIVRRARQRRHALRPNGALLRPLPPRGSRMRGVVAVGGGSVTSVGGQACAAHALNLRSKRFLRSDMMLQDGQSAGFVVQLDDGREARVPAGRVRLVGPRRQEREVSAAAVKLHLGRLDPLRMAPENAEELDPFPFDRTGELLLRPGDAVELQGRLEPVVEPGAAESGYRAAAASVLQPVGTFWLRLVPPRAG